MEIPKILISVSSNGHQNPSAFRFTDLLWRESNLPDSLHSQKGPIIWNPWSFLNLDNMLSKHTWIVVPVKRRRCNDDFVCLMPVLFCSRYIKMSSPYMYNLLMAGCPQGSSFPLGIDSGLVPPPRFRKVSSVSSLRHGWVITQQKTRNMINYPPLAGYGWMTSHIHCSLVCVITHPCRIYNGRWSLGMDE